LKKKGKNTEEKKMPLESTLASNMDSGNNQLQKQSFVELNFFFCSCFVCDPTKKIFKLMD
jgi:hypothetical protein